MDDLAAWFQVEGVPKPQGSMTMYGRNLVHKPELVAWRNQITAVAAPYMEFCGQLDRPLRLGCDFVLPRPGASRWWLPAVTPDLDKLIRALCDALSPKHGPRLVTNDSRFTTIRATKTYPDATGWTGVKVTIHYERKNS